MAWRRGVLTAGALAGAIMVSAVAQDPSQNPIGEIFASDASVKGAVLLVGSGMKVMSGSSVAAGQSVALLRLTRGGALRICPRTNLSISSSQTGRDLMFGMSTGAVEAEYSLAASADAILTPDFRLLLAGPGTFHVAIGSDVRGNTCVRSLDNNSASVIISELMGDGTYQVKPGEQIVFHNGKLANAGHDAAECGCTAPPSVLRAANPNLVPRMPPPAYTPPEPVPAKPAPEPATSIIANLKKTPRSSPPVPFDAPSPRQEPLPAIAANEVHVQVDAPFIFSANEPEPAPLEQVAHLMLSTTPELALIPAPPPPTDLRPIPLPPQAVAITRPESPKKNFFARVRSFFSSIFR